jgi:hypothetical protein
MLSLQDQSTRMPGNFRDLISLLVKLIRVRFTTAVRKTSASLLIRGDHASGHGLATCDPQPSRFYADTTLGGNFPVMGTDYVGALGSGTD